MSQVKVMTIAVGPYYTKDLDERLKKYGISHNALAREMEVSPSQVARWFNKPMTPRMENIAKIEQAVQAIRDRKAAERKAKREGRALAK